MNKKEMTYDFVCFSDLAYEFGDEDKQNIEKKIKRRLKYYSLGKFDPARVEYIRQIKNSLYIEINKYEKSKYYAKSDESNYSHPDDFKFDSLLSDFSDRYSDISKEEMGGFINFAIYLFYLR